MPHLYEALARRVDEWRAGGYPTAKHPAVAEIFEWASDADTGSLRYLRRPQLRALETYWYLRLVEGTPRIFDLYQRLFPTTPDLLDALGLGSPALVREALGGLPPLWARIRSDDAFVRQYDLEALRETLTLEYPSYILALAMGAGKTILIGAIFATEFALAMEYPEGPFVQNALVFAPGKTIIESLRELAAIPYDRILPPRFHKPFAASVKLIFTRDGEKDIPVVRQSLYNVVVTNTEKIRIQKEAVRRSDLAGLLARGREDEARAEVANLRLQALASLPNLAVFSDEAHHTYGQSLDAELKKVRKTVDYLAGQTGVVTVVNTTGTPYFKRQPLKDVVVWYGLSRGVRDGILKDVSGSIQAFDFAGRTDAYVAHVVEDFFRDYGQVQLPDGAPARLAIYFPQMDDLAAARPAIDTALARVGQSPALCLRNTSESSKDEIDAFNRLNDPAAPHRVILLVNKGTEGWNCPSLFACALARRLRSSNNFVLQAATRCLRQVAGNVRKARIYLSQENRAVLDRQLQETYGESIADLDLAGRELRSARLVLRKRHLPPVTLTRLVRTVVPAAGGSEPLRLQRPAPTAGPALGKAVLDIVEQPGRRALLRQLGDTIAIETQPETVGRYEAAVALAAAGRADLWAVHDELARGYGPEQDIPVADLPALAAQIADQSRRYRVHEERVEWALALVRPEGFVKDTDAGGAEVYTAEITYPRDREHLLLAWEALDDNPRDLGFHYSPYNFDSTSEREVFTQILRELNVAPGDVEDIYFTGGLTDPAKTDFRVEYRGEDGRWHFYTPDFVIRKRGPRPGTGRVLIVEVKADRFRREVAEDEAGLARGEEPRFPEGRKAIALRKLERINPGRLKYELVFVKDRPAYDDLAGVRRFVREPERAYGYDGTAAARLVDRILETEGAQARKIILFGSRARGDALPDSDYDLLIVLATLPPEERHRRLVDLYRALAGAGVGGEPHVMSETEFEESKDVIGSLAHPAAKEGVILYEAP
jgi:type III restriction enzyme